MDKKDAKKDPKKPEKESKEVKKEEPAAEEVEKEEVKEAPKEKVKVQKTPEQLAAEKAAQEAALRKYLYRGHNLDELRQMNMKDFMALLTSRQRRSATRGMPRRQKKLLKKLKRAKRAQKEGKDIIIRTHNRDMIIYPEFIGLTISVHNGLQFLDVKISPEHIGHYLGEYAPTCKTVKHSNPGVGATKSSQFVPLK